MNIRKENNMKLMIAGSRGITEFDFTDYIPKETELIITGGASGIDTIAEKYADNHKLSKLILRPKYNIYGKAAPLKRNEEMIALADHVLVVWDGKSRGTKFTIDTAQKMNKPITVITTEH